MLKRTRIFFLLLMGALMLSACGSKGNETKEEVNVTGESQKIENAEGFDFLGSSNWKIQGFRYEGQVISITQNVALESMYQSKELTFSEDGTYKIIDVITEEGVYKPYSGDSDHKCYLLQTERLTRLIPETEGDEGQEVNHYYLLTVWDDNTIECAEFDVMANKEVEDSFSFIYVRKGTESRYIENEINGSETSNVLEDENEDILEETVFGIGDVIETADFKMTLDDISIVSEYEFTTSDYSSTSVFIEDGYQALMLRGKIENKGMSVIKTYAFVLSAVVNDSFERDNNDVRFNIERSNMSEIDPYTEQNYDIYINIPDKLADQYKKVEFKIGFRNDLETPTQRWENGETIYEDVDNWYTISSEKKKTGGDGAITAEKVKEDLQGGWTLDGSGGFVFAEDTFYLLGNGAAAKGTYEVDLSQSCVHVLLEATNGQVKVDISYNYKDGEIRLINNNNEELKKDDNFAPEYVKRVKESDSNVPVISMSNVSDVSASSYLYEAEYDKGHYPSYLIDGYMDNAWVEGVSGYGEGESITLTFDGTYKVSGFKINAGYQKSGERYYQNGRPASLIVYFSNGSSEKFQLEDVYDAQYFDFKNPVSTNYIKFEIGSTYSGYDYTDTCISELSLY